MSIISIAGVYHWHWLLCTSSGSVCPSCASTCNARGAPGGIQHTLTAHGISWFEGSGRGIVIQARVIIVVWRFQEISRSHGDMVFGGMMFGEVISAVSGAAPPIDMVLFLSDAVADPIKAHVHCFGVLLLHGFVGDAAGGAVVSDHRGGRLGVPQFFQGDAEGRAFFAVVKEGGEFSLSCAGKDFTHDFAGDTDGAVHRRRRIGGRWRVVGIGWIVA